MRRLLRRQFGDPILRQKANGVPPQLLKTRALRRLTDRMFFTLRRVGGVGLAAPQIGKSLQLAVIEIKRTPVRPRVTPLPPTVIANPRILKRSNAVALDWEGCLSLPNVRGLVPRHDRIMVQYFDYLGERRTVRLKGFQARVFQHEIDHHNGILFVDRMLDMKSLMTVREFRQRILTKKGLMSR